MLCLGRETEDSVVRLAAGVEGHSEHPIAAGIARAGEDRGIDVPEATGFEAMTGRGVRAPVGGATVQELSPGAAT